MQARGQTQWGPEGWRALRVGPKGGAPKGGAPTGGGPKISRFFFPSPATKFVRFFPLWGSSRGILVLFLKAGTLKCARLGSLVVV